MSALTLFDTMFPWIRPLSIHWPWRRGSQLQIAKRVCLGWYGRFLLHSDISLIRIGEATAIGDRFNIVSHMPITIGRHCLFSWNVSIVNFQHRLDGVGSPHQIAYGESRAIHIGDRCFIGCNAVILNGVTLGDDCVVGAGAIVTKSWPAGSRIAGSPARLTKEKETDEFADCLPGRITTKEQMYE